MKKYTKGFTLIELLVVIAIIGILASVVLVSLNTARSKGKDAALQSTIAGIRPAMEVYYSNNTNSYNNGFTSNNTCGSGNTDINTYVTNANFTTSAAKKCFSSATEYVVIAQLLSDTTKYYCVDAKGNAGAATQAEYDAVSGTSIKCR